MMNHEAVFAIPASSPGLFLDDDVHFASSCFLFSSNTFVPLTEDIVSIHRSKNYFVTTAERLYVVSNKVIAGLNRVVTALAVKGDLLAVGCKQAVELWRLQTSAETSEPKKPAFSLVQMLQGHSDAITSTMFFGDIGIVSTSLDCTTRLHYVDSSTKTPRSDAAPQGTSKVIATHKSAPLKAFDINGCLVVVTKSGVITYANAKWETTDRVYLGEDVRGVDRCGDAIVALLSAGEPGMPKRSKIAVVRNGVKKIVDFDEEFFEISANSTQVALKGSTLSIYDVEFGTLTRLIDLLSITAMCEHRDRLAVGCADFKVRVYQPFAAWRASERDTGRPFSSLKARLGGVALTDDNAREAPFNIHWVDNVLVSVTLSAHVSIFNIADARCFRSFALNLKVRTSAVNADLSILFVAGVKLQVVDLKRSKVIDTFDHHVISVRCVGERVYFLTQDALLVYDYKDFTVHPVRLQSGLIGKGVCVVNSNTVTMYDLGLNYVRSVRGTKILYHGSQKAIVENGNVQIVDLETMRTCVLDVENPQNVVYSTSSQRVYVLVANSVRVYDSKASFLDLDLHATAEAFDTEFCDTNYLKALVVAIKMGRRDLVRRVISTTFFTVKNLNMQYVSELKKAAVEMVASDTMMAVKWLRMCFFEYEHLELDETEAHRVRSTLERAMEVGRKNLKLINNLGKEGFM